MAPTGKRKFFSKAQAKATAWMEDQQRDKRASQYKGDKLVKEKN